MTPVLCMITDRRRFGQAWSTALPARVAAVARAGVHLIQVREPDLDARALVDLVRRCVEEVAGTTARVVVNDRLDVALAAGAHGVHLRGASVPAWRVRAVAPAAFVIGRSVHARDEAVAATAHDAVDYLLFGTVYATDSKPGRAAAGVEALAAVASGVTVPVLAVGGVTIPRCRELARAGAAGVAAIGLFSDGPDEHVSKVAREAANAFDTRQAVP
jgi:thiamine-phosphate pyrophosphorylase